MKSVGCEKDCDVVGEEKACGTSRKDAVFLP